MLEENTVASMSNGKEFIMSEQNRWVNGVNSPAIAGRVDPVEPAQGILTIVANDIADGELEKIMDAASWDMQPFLPTLASAA